MAFVDGQNLFHAAKRAFGYRTPNYDPKALAATVCRQRWWTLTQTRFYAGVPSVRDDPFRSRWWAARLQQMARVGVWTFSRGLRYREQAVRVADGTTTWVRTGQEKGIDVRIAIDVIRLAHALLYDVALVFSQDQDLSEVAAEIRVIAWEQRRWIKIASAFPAGPRRLRGIDGTDWIAIDRATYDACLDPRDYRPKRRPL